MLFVQFANNLTCVFLKVKFATKAIQLFLTVWLRIFMPQFPKPVRKLPQLQHSQFYCRLCLNMPPLHFPNENAWQTLNVLFITFIMSWIVMSSCSVVLAGCPRIWLCCPSKDVCSSIYKVEVRPSKMFVLFNQIPDYVVQRWRFCQSFQSLEQVLQDFTIKNENKTWPKLIERDQKEQPCQCQEFLFSQIYSPI